MMELRQGSVVHFLLLLRGGGETPFFFFFLFFLFFFPTPDNAKVPLLPGSIGHSSSFQAAPPPLSRQKGETFSTDNEPHFFSRREKFEPPLNRNTIARIREIATTPSFHRLRSARDNSRAFHTGAHSLSLSLPLSAKLQLSTSIRNVAPNEVDRPKPRLERGHALMEGSAGIGRSRGSTIAFFPAFLVFRANDRVLREESNGETLEKW